MRKGPGLCHGVSGKRFKLYSLFYYIFLFLGNAYAFLMAYRLTNKSEYLDMAKVFAYIMMSSDFQVIFYLASIHNQA